MLAVSALSELLGECVALLLLAAGVARVPGLFARKVVWEAALGLPAEAVSSCCRLALPRNSEASPPPSPPSPHPQLPFWRQPLPAAASALAFCVLPRLVLARPRPAVRSCPLPEGTCTKSNDQRSITEHSHNHDKFKKIICLFRRLNNKVNNNGELPISIG